MVIKKFKRQKKCSECGRNISYWARSGLCRHCSQAIWAKKRKKKMKEDHICWDCGKKVEPVYPLRCEKCRKKNRENGKRRREKKYKEMEVEGKEETSI